MELPCEKVQEKRTRKQNKKERIAQQEPKHRQLDWNEKKKSKVRAKLARHVEVHLAGMSCCRDTHIAEHGTAGDINRAPERRSALNSS